ncbi:MAG: ATP-dependent zinc metalloprotease FtsH [Gemmatimonadetes bacterium]|nr:ATP-dependent zinc metalloprotease FtsH [Gemmatimonadota bacterium]
MKESRPGKEGPRARKPDASGQSRGNRQHAPRRTRTIVMWVLLALLSVVLVQFFSRNRSDEMEIGYSVFRNHLANGNVLSVTMLEKTIVGEFRNGVSTPVPGGRESLETRFKVEIPFEDPELIDELVRRNVTITARPKSAPWYTHLLTWLPLFLIIGLWIFIFRQMQGGQKGLFSMGKSQARLTGEREGVKFSEVAGVEEAKRDLQEVVEFLKHPDKFKRFGARLPKGVLLLGPPGTGKTLLARAVAGEAGVPFFTMSGADFMEMFVGVGASRVRDLFKQGKENAPCIIFIDELDAVGRHRGAGLGGGHDEREQTLNQMLVEMDGFEPNSGVVLIAATNRPDVLDPALLRPGRFDRHVTVDRPDVRGREQILQIKATDKPLAECVDLKTLARLTPGMSGADLENIVNEAALLAARVDHKQITMSDLERARDRIVMGSEHQLIMSEEERRTVAYHESGHAMTAALIPEIDSPHSVTIIPRGQALGITYAIPEEDQYLYSEAWCRGQIACLLAGQVAERIGMGDTFNGAGDDIKRATELARHMVCGWGMGELGPLALGNQEGEVFLGRELTRKRDYSNKTAVKVDEDIRRIMDSSRQRAESILTERADALHRMADALLEHETLHRDQVVRLLEGKTLESPARPEIHSEKSEVDAASRKEETRTGEDEKTPAPTPFKEPPLAAPGV